jgi:hypothetical protein
VVLDIPPPSPDPACNCLAVTVPVPGAGEQKWAELPQWQNDIPHLNWSPDGEQFLSAERESARQHSLLTDRIGGAQVLRVHDVKANVDALRTTEALLAKTA